MDLNTLARQGVHLVGRLAGIREGKAQFSGSLRNVCALADLKMDRLLATIDEWIDSNGYAKGIGPARTLRGDAGLPEHRASSSTSRTGRIRTIIWATGYRPDYSWLKVPVFDRKGGIRHDGGIGETPGLYVMGLPFLRRRKSSFIHGAEDDARELSNHLAGYLGAHQPRASTRLAV